MGSISNVKLIGQIKTWCIEEKTWCTEEWDGWAHKPGLTYLSLVCSPGPSVVLCVHYQYL